MKVFIFSEFRSQLTQLEKSTPHIPSLVTKDLVKEHILQSQSSHTSHESQFRNTQLELEKKREEHKHLLRPSLGHPHQVNQLTSLCEAETERHNEYMAAVEKQSETLQVRIILVWTSSEFLDNKDIAVLILKLDQIGLTVEKITPIDATE